jgi:hypothetical protein
MTTLDSAKGLFLATILFFGAAAFAQAVPWLDDPPVQSSQPQAASQTEAITLPLGTMAPAPSAVTIPAGTRVLMVLTSPLHTTSGTAGSGLYLETLYPVIEGNRVVIPAHTYVQGVVEADKRPGHVDRVAEFRFRFTTLIFPNNFVAPIQGALQSIPGAKNIRTQDTNGALKTVDQTEKVIAPTAVSAVGGAIIGSEHSFGIGKFTGAGLGAALGLGAVLLKRGDEINLARGTNVEMVLQAPLILEQAQVVENARYGARPSTLTEPQNASSLADGQDRRRRPQQYRPIRLPGLLFPFF